MGHSARPRAQCPLGTWGRMSAGTTWHPRALKPKIVRPCASLKALVAAYDSASAGDNAMAFGVGGQCFINPSRSMNTLCHHLCRTGKLAAHAESLHSSNYQGGRLYRNPHPPRCRILDVGPVVTESSAPRDHRPVNRRCFAAHWFAPSIPTPTRGWVSPPAPLSFIVSPCLRSACLDSRNADVTTACFSTLSGTSRPTCLRGGGRSQLCVVLRSRHGHLDLGLGYRSFPRFTHQPTDLPPRGGTVASRP